MKAMTGKRRGSLIAAALALGALALIAFGLVRSLTPRDVSKEDPSNVFRSFICDPLPASVSDVKADGILAFAGGNVVIDFAIEDRDRENLLKQGGFTEPDEHHTEWISQNDPFGDSGGSTAFVHVEKGMNQVALYFAKHGNRARFHYISY